MESLPNANYGTDSLVIAAQNKQPLLVLIWVVFVYFHKPLATPHMDKTSVLPSLTGAGDRHFLGQALGLEVRGGCGSAPLQPSSASRTEITDDFL